MVAPRLARMRELAAEHGRTLRFGIRLHVISRDRAKDAWAETERFLDALDPARRGRRAGGARRRAGRSASSGWCRCTADRATTCVIAPNLWAGIGLVRGGAGTALVGSHEEVADRIEEYHDLGFDEFILSGHPHLEEAYWFGEGVMPILRRRGLLPEVERRPDDAALVLGRGAVTNAR